MEIIKPQPGPQENFLSSPADIVIYGGAAGGGKTWGLLLEPLRHVLTTPGFEALILRRNSVQIRNQGGLWDASMRLYPKAGLTPKSTFLTWEAPNGNSIKMAHLEKEATVLSYQGAEIPLICFDELTHFSENQFFYMLSRNRSLTGVRGYVRATTNPDPDSWVAKFIDWWIGADGYPIPERSGVLRWFIRLDDVIRWADSPEELIEKYQISDAPEHKIMPKSVTFISAKITDNKRLMEADPAYIGNLRALDRVQRERLELGNWKIKPAGGMYFRRAEAVVIDRMPLGNIRWVRRWDLAATEPTRENPDPDFTVGVLMGKYPDGRIVIADCVYGQWRSHVVREKVCETAEKDGKRVSIGLSQDPGQAGKDQIGSYVRMPGLRGFRVISARETGDKVTRAEGFASFWQNGQVDIVRGAWNDWFFTILENFPEKDSHDDAVDAASGAFYMLTSNDFNLRALAK